MPNTFLEAWSLGVPALSLSIDADGVHPRALALGVVAEGSWERFVAWRARAVGLSRTTAPSSRSERGAYVRDVHSMRSVGDKWEALLGKLGVVALAAGIASVAHA